MRSLCQHLILERFLERFWKCFGEVFWYNFDTFFILLSISCWKGFGKGFGSNSDRFWNDFGLFLKLFGRSCWHDFVIPLYIIYIGLLTVFVSGICRDILMVLWTGQKVPLIWWYFSQIVFVQCDADVSIIFVSIILRSRCQNECEPMSRRMRSRCQDECEADVKILRSRCRNGCEADVRMDAKPMSR